MPRSKSIESAELASRVVALRRQRLSFRDIGEQIERSAARAHQIYYEALAAIPAADIVAARQEEAELIDDALRDLITMATDVSVSERTRVEAWNSARGWSEHRSRMLGLNAPTRSQVEVFTPDAVDDAIRELEEQMAAADES